ncbi:MAG: DJ-1/PfpI family protein [Candidatus Thermoplasmatota archaeon]|jgi:protease I|nr:DJ-1/PfpI family protein [Candidatus Thermoplasmatota archaeon]MCL5963357.1 DJ-1/PfpI family protein [Candidatus Thermoplasmatota archaeon]
MKKIGIMLDDGFHDLELWIPYYRLKEENIDFDILAWNNREYKGQFGIDSITPTRLLSQDVSDYGLIYFPGAKSPINLLKKEATIDIIHDLSKNKTHMVTICHSPLLLSKAGLLKGKHVTGHPSIKNEIEMEGAIFEDSSVVKSSEFITSAKTHFQLAEFMPEFLKLCRSD